jgi:uncharacterized membrane protein YccF (DUF307 family)
MHFIGNIIWVIFGGFLLSLLWYIAGAICCITIIGIPFGLQAFKMGNLVLWPFGRDVDFSEMGTGSVILNFLWIVFFGWELAMLSGIIGVLFCVTIIGIPFGLQWFKFAKLALLPFGAKIIGRDD